MNFSPHPKPLPKNTVKQVKIKKVSNKPVYTCSDGTKVSQAYINRKLSESYATGLKTANCTACGKQADGGHAHIVSQKVLKLKHAELIWDSQFYRPHCLSCHNAWDGSSHSIEDHIDIVEKMALLYFYDYPNFCRKFERLSNHKIMEAINKRV